MIIFLVWFCCGLCAQRFLCGLKVCFGELGFIVLLFAYRGQYIWCTVVFEQTVYLSRSGFTACGSQCI